MIVLWCGAMYFVANYENKNVCWICAVPATFMSAVSITYLLYAPECFNLGAHGTTGLTVSYVGGVVVACGITTRNFWRVVNLNLKNT